MGIINHVDNIFMGVLRALAKHSNDENMLHILDRIRMRQLKEKFEHVWSWVQDKYEDIKENLSSEFSSEEDISDAIFTDGIERYPELFNQFQMASATMDLAELVEVEGVEDLEMEESMAEIEVDDDGGIVESILESLWDWFS